jgi:hypothetical protein
LQKIRKTNKGGQDFNTLFLVLLAKSQNSQLSSKHKSLQSVIQDQSSLQVDKPPLHFKLFDKIIFTKKWKEHEDIQNFCTSHERWREYVTNREKIFHEQLSLQEMNFTKKLAFLEKDFTEKLAFQEKSFTEKLNIILKKYYFRKNKIPRIRK